jgi:two-component system, OmpR family, phosphate regulon response regulator PhoB
MFVTCMSKANIVFLAMENPLLLRAVRAMRPALKVTVIDGHIPETPIEGQLYCFVDWVLPEYSGLEMCNRLRMSYNTKSAHITMVMESRDCEAQRRALRAGADSYIMGPLTAEMIIHRIESHSEVSNDPKPIAKLSHGDLTIDLAAYRVKYRDRTVTLPPNEFRVLTHFIENPDRLLTRKSLIEMLGKNSEGIDERIVNVWIRRLRRTLSEHHVPDPLRTVRAKGYVMDSIAS